MKLGLLNTNSPAFISKASSNIPAIFKTKVLNEQQVYQSYEYQNGNSVEQHNLEMIISPFVSDQDERCGCIPKLDYLEFFP